jgi:hypothetical protein
MADRKQCDSFSSRPSKLTATLDSVLVNHACGPTIAKCNVVQSHAGSRRKLYSPPSNTKSGTKSNTYPRHVLQRIRNTNIRLQQCSSLDQKLPNKTQPTLRQHWSQTRPRSKTKLDSKYTDTLWRHLREEKMSGYMQETAVSKKRSRGGVS